MSSSSFVHLHCRSYFSIKDGAYSPEELARRAAESGMSAVALTDRNGLYGAVRFTDACRQVGIKPILGSWLTLGGRAAEARRMSGATGSTSFHVLLLARDARGYANLCRLITEGHMAGERGEPSVSPRQVMKRAEGLVCLLGSESPPGVLALNGR